MNDLYINGSRVDLPVDNDISLQFRSNFMGGLDVIKSGYSLTIKLPSTPINDFVMRLSNLVYAGDNAAYKWYNAVYVVDGVQLIHGQAALLSASPEGYDVSLTWGIVPELREWLNSDKTLRDLSLDGIGRIVVNNNPFDNDVFDTQEGLNVGLYYYNNGIRNYPNVENVWYPVVKVGYIFREILSSLGGVIDVSAVDLSELDSLYINIVENMKEATTANNRTFRVVDFLPEIKQSEFVKAICHIQGWYIEQNVTGGIRLVDVDSISDKAEAVDWSSKLSRVGDLPENIEFSYNNNAQRNYMRYKEDDNVLINADGYIEVNDVTADAEKTWFTLPWAATYGNLIVQYDKEGNFIKIEPRILKLEEDRGTDSEGNLIPGLAFTDDMYFQYIINTSYSYYKTIVNQPSVITAEFYLTAYDYLTIDYAKPVYISRYGSYFAVIGLQYSSEKTKATLIKLP